MIRLPSRIVYKMSLQILDRWHRYHLALKIRTHASRFFCELGCGDKATILVLFPLIEAHVKDEQGFTQIDGQLYTPGSSSHCSILLEIGNGKHCFSIQDDEDVSSQ